MTFNLSECDAVHASATGAISVQRPTSRRKPLLVAYMALLVFMFINYSRPEDWIPGLSSIPLAKIAGFLALFALVFSLQHIHQRLPREVLYLALLIGQLFLAAAVSPVWRGGAFYATLDFAKVIIVIVVTALAVNTSRRLRMLIFTQAASVALISSFAVLKGRLLIGRLEGTLGGNYSAPNEFALAMVITLPLCLALLFLSKSRLWKTAWALAMLVMTFAIIQTASRAGFLSLVVIAAVCLWEFAIRGRQRYLLVLAALSSVILWHFSSGVLAGRLKGTFDPNSDTAAAYASSEARQQLFWRSVEVTKEHPVFGIGTGNFQQLSGNWHVTHNSFTEMSSEGGLPALVLYVLILWIGFKNLRATKRFGRGQKELVILAGSLHASLAGYVVGSLFASTAYQLFPYFLVAYSTSLVRVTKNSGFRFEKREPMSESATEKKVLINSTMSDLSWYSY